MGNCQVEHELYDDSLDNEIATVRMRAQELHRQWCHKAIEFLEAHMNVFIDAKASDILAIVGRRYKAYCCNASYDKYARCTFLVHCSQSAEVWGFYVDQKGRIVIACYRYVRLK